MNTETIETPVENTVETFCEQLEGVFDTYTVVKSAYPHPFKEGEDSENFGLFLPDHDHEELPQTFKVGYKPHTLKDVCAVVASAEEVLDFTDAEMTATWINGHRVTFRFGEAVEVAPNDFVYPTFNIHCGYDGRAFKAIFGLFRMICENGMIIPVAGMNYATCRLVHTKNLHERMPEMIAKLQETSTQISGMFDFAKKLAGKTVNFDLIYAEVFGEKPETESGRSETIWDNRKTEMWNIASKEIAQLEGSFAFNNLSAWQMFNTIQGYYQNVQGKKNDRNAMQATDWANNRTELQVALEILSK